MKWIEQFWLDTLLYQRGLFPIEYIKYDMVTAAIEEDWLYVLPIIIFDQLFTVPGYSEWYCCLARRLFQKVPWMITGNLYRVSVALSRIGYVAGRHKNFPYEILDN